MTRAGVGRITQRTTDALRVAFGLGLCGCVLDFDAGEVERSRGNDLPIPGIEAPDGWIWRLHPDPAQSENPPPSGRFDALDPPARRAVNPPPQVPTPFVPARLRKVTTEHLGQWTGRNPNLVDALGFSGTDLGISFPHRERLWFVFGDSQSVFDYCGDSLAHVPLAPLGEGALPKLTWLTRPEGSFAPITVPGIDLGYMNVPVEGISIDDARAYLFFATQWSDSAGRHAGSAVAHSDSPTLAEWTLDHSVETSKFVNVSLVREGAYVYVWGSGEFRKSDVYLARVRVESLGDRDQWEYFRSWEQGGRFGPGEDSARPIVSAGCVGELSVRRHPRLGLYLLAYNCDLPRGVFLRTAESAIGPYSEPIQLFEPWLDKGYEHFMHIAPELSGRDDGLSDASRESSPGGEYGPYLIPEWFTETPDGTYSIAYTLSSWNPYQVHVLRTLLVDVNTPLPPPATPSDGLETFATVEAANLALRDMTAWSHAGDGYSLEHPGDGALVVSSAVQPLGAAATGTLWRDFSVDAAITALEFEVQGGDAEVLLVANDEVVRRVRGRGDGVWRPVVFQLEGLRGRPLRVALYDRATDAWGFIAVRNLRLR